MNLVVLFNFVDLVNLVILVILLILDFPVIWLNLVDLVSSHFGFFAFNLHTYQYKIKGRKIKTVVCNPV